MAIKSILGYVRGVSGTAFLLALPPFWVNHSHYDKLGSGVTSTKDSTLLLSKSVKVSGKNAYMHIFAKRYLFNIQLVFMTNCIFMIYATANKVLAKCVGNRDIDGQTNGDDA
uniref:Uncharacterized protein n=1 Tax=Glossina austeni TaxID=7395 RepID=A0A1A9UK04_GLOAU